MNNKLWVGQDALSFKAYSEAPAITQIILATDENAEDAFYAGEDGYSLTVYCPWATQQMANDLLAKAQGFQYQGFEASMANLPGNAERGDGVSVGGVYAMLADRTLYFNPGMNSDISAPYEEEVNHEFKYVSQIRQDYNRVIAQVRASLIVDIDNITQQVTGIDGEVTALKVTLDGVTITDSSGTTLINGSKIETSELYVDAANITGQLTASQINAENLQVSAANITGTLTIGQLPSDVATDSDIPTKVSQLTNDSGYQNASGVTTIVNGTVTTDYVEALGITVNAANITGKLTIGQLPSSVAQTSDIPTYTSQLINNSGYQNASGVTSIINGTVTTDYVNALDIYAATLRGNQIQLLQGSGAASGTMSLTSASSGNYAVDITSNAALRLVASSGKVFISSGPSSNWWSYLQLNTTDSLRGIVSQNVMPNATDSWYLGNYNERYSGVYVTSGLITSSDRNLKHNIQPMPQKYLSLLYGLEPSIFQMDAGTSGRYHAGFIAQDVEAEMAANDISDMEFAGLVIGGMDTDNPVYMLRYEEFIAIAVKAIQDLNARLKRLEEAS